MNWFSKEFWAVKEAHLSLRKATLKEKKAETHRSLAFESSVLHPHSLNRITHLSDAHQLDREARQLRGRHMFFLTRKPFSRD